MVPCQICPNLFFLAKLISHLVLSVTGDDYYSNILGAGRNALYALTSSIKCDVLFEFSQGWTSMTSFIVLTFRL